MKSKYFNRLTIFFALMFLFLMKIDLATAQTLDELSSVVAFLSTKSENNKIRSGTGFFISSGKFLYLVTADHISQFLTKDSDITVRTKGDIPFSFKFSRVTNSENTIRSLSWVRHDNADIAILPLYPDQDLINNVLKGHFLPLSFLYTKKEAVSREVIVTILGFPLNLGHKGFFSPISRETKPASGFLTLRRFDTNQPTTFFITQDPSAGGFSGAPVFDMRLPIQSTSTLSIIGAPPRIVGIVHGTLSDRTGGKLGAICPSFLIKELIDNFERTLSK